MDPIAAMVRPAMQVSEHILPAGAQIVEEAPYGVLVIREYLTLELCRYIREHADAQPSKPLEVYGSAGAQVDAQRVTHLVAIDRIANEMLGIFNDIYCNRLAKFYNVDFDFYERPQILKYPPGGKYNEHSDSEYWTSADGEWHRAVDRDYSVILYLNDDFEGGDLHFVPQNFDLRPAPGMLVAFPSDHHFEHAVLPTVSGVRYSIVSWATIVDSPRVRNMVPYGSVYLRQREPMAARSAEVNKPI